MPPWNQWHCHARGIRETGALADDRNPVEEPRHSIHPSGSPWPPHSIQNNTLIMLAESRSLRRKFDPAHAGFDENQRDASIPPRSPSVSGGSELYISDFLTAIWNRLSTRMGVSY